MAQGKETFGRWNKKFIKTLAATGNVAEACRVAGITRPTAYTWKNKDTPKGEAFRERWEEALDSAVQLLELELRRRAYEGNEEPVFFQGKEIATVRKYSDVLGMFLLKAHRPDVYRDNYRRLEHTGPGGGPVMLISEMNDAQLLAILGEDDVPDESEE